MGLPLPSSGFGSIQWYRERVRAALDNGERVRVAELCECHGRAVSLNGANDKGDGGEYCPEGVPRVVRNVYALHGIPYAWHDGVKGD